MDILAIRTQGEGDLLKVTGSSTILKANYNFGKGYVFNANNDILYAPTIPRLVGKPIPSIFSAFAFHKTIGVDGADARSATLSFAGVGGVMHNSICLSHPSYNLGSAFVRKIDGAHDHIIPLGATGGYGDIHYGWDVDTIAGKVRRHGRGTYSNWENFTMPSIPALENVHIAYGPGCNAGSAPGRIRTPIPYLAVFSRTLSLAEHKHVYNKLLSNAPITMDGCFLLFKMDFAEILDFSEAQDGSNMGVGIRDFSGNDYHAKINMIPAGTLEEQVAWANTNRFQFYK